MPNLDDPAPWRWGVAAIKEQVGRVRAGRNLLGSAADQRWPAGAHCTVALSFDADHETLALRDGKLSPAHLARGEYGARVGVPRILSLLERHSIHATFFVPAVSALLHPEEVPRLHDGGHEIGVHGWIHERNAELTRAEEYELLVRSLEVLEQQCGQRPVGLRTPSWDFTVATLDLMQDVGLRYDSSLMADDDPYEILQDGRPTGIVEIPVDWIRDDFPYFSIDPQSRNLPRMTAMQVAETWISEFDAAYRHHGVFELTMHPHVIGHNSHLRALEALLDYISSLPGIWFATHAELADHLRLTCGLQNERVIK